MKYIALGLLAGLAMGQTQINLPRESRNVDFSGAVSTRPEKTGASLPGTCSVGQLFFNTSAAAGSNLYGCVATNTWAVLSGGGSGGGSGGNGPGICFAFNASAPNALVCTITGFTLTSGSMVNLFVTAATTSASVTLAINGSAGIPVDRGSGNAPTAGEIGPSETPVLLSYNGTVFEVVNDSFEAGPTNCLSLTRTSFPWTIDINTSCLPELTTANTFSGYNNFSGGQIRLPESTVGTLPSASANTGKEFIVTDGASSSDCSTGGGSNVVSMCRSNGTAWVFIGGSGGGGSTLTDAGGTGYGSWAPFGIGTGGSSFTYGTGGTTYFIEMSGLPLMTVSSVVMQDTGPGGTHYWAFALYRTDGAGGCNLVANTSGLAFTGGGFDTNALLSAYQLQPSTTYYAAWSSDTSGGTHTAVIGSEQLFNPDTGGGSNSNRYFTGNTTAWSGGTPTFPSTCGTRTKFTGNIPLIMLRHN